MIFIFILFIDNISLNTQIKNNQLQKIDSRLSYSKIISDLEQKEINHLIKHDITKLTYGFKNRLQFSDEEIKLKNIVQQKVKKDLSFILSEQTINLIILYFIRFIEEYNNYKIKKEKELRKTLKSFVFILKYKFEPSYIDHKIKQSMRNSHVDISPYYHSIMTLFGPGTLYYPDQKIDLNSRTQSCFLSNKDDKRIMIPEGIVIHTTQYKNRNKKAVCHEAPLFRNRIVFLAFTN